MGSDALVVGIPRHRSVRWAALAAISRLGSRGVPRRVKVTSDVRYDLAIGRVVGSLESDDPLRDPRFVLLEVSQEMKLRHRGTENQDRLGAPKRAGDLAEKARLVVRMIATLCLLILRVPMHVMHRGMDRRLVEVLRVDMEDLGFTSVDPHRHLIQ
jgi:hypothetical protein